MLEQVREWYAYTWWANARMLDAAAALSEEQLGRDLGTSFRSVHGTLVHMLGAEWLWLERCHGRSHRAFAGANGWRALGDIRAAWDAVAAGQRSFLATVTEARLAAPLAYTNMAGEPHCYSLGHVLSHVVNHATYHRGQVAAMLRQLGASATSTDFTLFAPECDRP
ncbi:MAG TPA: DinB family protein [Gemmatimonadaceae bacterium]|nr:DinB family protein [Gemmatimonadaceae bacterium]